MPNDEVAHLVEADLRRLVARAEKASARAGEVRAVANASLERGYVIAAEVGRVVEVA